MIFNAGKFKLLQFWLDRDEVSNILYVAPDGRPIEEKDCLWDWAIRVSIDLTFNNQIDIVVQSGNQMAWLALLFQKKGYGYHDHELLSIYLSISTNRNNNYVTNKLYKLIPTSH